MPKITNTPQHLKPFAFHGLDLTPGSSNQATGECPFCRREGKFYVSLETGQWDCKVCLAKGNVVGFVRKLWEESYQATADYEPLARDRRLDPDTLIQWGVCQSVVTGEWLVPGYSADKKLVNLYRYVHSPVENRKVLLATPELPHGVHGATLHDPAKQDLYWCEGPWDGMALWEVLRVARWEDGEFLFTGNPASSLLATSNVLAIPGCGSVGAPFERWTPLAEGKWLCLPFDSDHPRLTCKVCRKTYSSVLHPSCPRGHGPLGPPEVPPTGATALRRAAAVLSRASSKPRELAYLHWGDGGFDPSLPHGYDLRDLLTEGYDPSRPWAEEIPRRIANLPRFVEMIHEAPRDWGGGISPTAAMDPASQHVDLLPCTDWTTLALAWHEAVELIPGLEQALAVELAVITSTDQVGEQLWVKVMGPPSCGKTTICEAISVARRWVVPKDTLTGLFSGYQTDREGSEDLSLAVKMRGKTLAIKDADPVLKAANRAQILAQLRALFDRAVRTSYGNKMSKDHEGMNTTVVIHGTGALKELDSSDLGERFLDVVIIDDMEDDMEERIGWKVAMRAAREITMVSDGKLESRDGPEMVKAKKLTGGYVDHLRRNAPELLAEVQAPEWALKRCQTLAKFVSYMRARPSKLQDERAEREMPFRLTSQFVRLACCLAVVLNKKEVDHEVMDRVTRVALDTARGKVFDLCRRMRGEPSGTTVQRLASLTNDAEEGLRPLVRFLRRIGVVEKAESPADRAYQGKTKWRLTDRFCRVHDSVMGTPGHSG